MELTEFLLTHLDNAEVGGTGKSEIIAKCPYCGKDGKFYVKIVKEDGDLPFFNCFRASCGASGIVNAAKLIEWGIYDPSVGVELSAYLNKINRGSNKVYLNKEQVYPTRYTYIANNDLNNHKLNYINERLGVHLTLQDCIRLRIVLSINDLLEENSYAIRSLTRKQEVVDSLDYNFIGFISYDRAFLNMRNLNLIEEPFNLRDQRYVNYNLYDKKDNTHRFYVIPAKIDLEKHISIHIAEGAFDILSIALNLRKNLNNHIYSSIAGGAYIGILKFYINTMKLVDIDIHIYMDNDVPRRMVDRIYELLYPFNKPVFIHRNIFPGEKDFGVPVTKIKEEIERII